MREMSSTPNAPEGNSTGSAAARAAADGAAGCEAAAAANPPSSIPRLAPAVARRARESEPLVVFYLERRVCQRAALQARFRSRTS